MSTINLEIIKYNKGLKFRDKSKFYINGSIDFKFNDWNGFLKYDSNPNTPPSYFATNGMKMYLEY